MFELSNMRMSARRAALAALAGLCLADVTPLAARAADVELGKYLSTECLTCHRAAPSAAIPNIFGIAETTFAEVLKAYRSRHLPNDVMQTIAGRLKDDEIEALAAYFATAKRP